MIDFFTFFLEKSKSKWRFDVILTPWFKLLVATIIGHHDNAGNQSTLKTFWDEKIEIFKKKFFILFSKNSFLFFQKKFFQNSVCFKILNTKAFSYKITKFILNYDYYTSHQDSAQGSPYSGFLYYCGHHN